MKKFSLVLALIVLAAFVAIPASAQDFASAKPQFISFSFGVPIGYDLSSSSMVAGKNFSIGFAIIDNLEVGYDSIGYAANTANLLRMAFNFTDQFGAAFGFGDMGGAAMSLGAFGNIFQGRAASGFAYGLGLRVDYVALANSFGDGAVLFTLRATFGL